MADTNVLISSFLSPHSAPARAISYLQSTHRLLGSPETIHELREVLLRDKFARIPVAQRLLLLDNFFELLDVIIPHLEITACRDPKDNKFLSLAVAGSAALILTGDTDLLTLHPFQGIHILSPTSYLEAAPLG